jgi:hypothetical protein
MQALERAKALTTNAAAAQFAIVNCQFAIVSSLFTLSAAPAAATEFARSGHG